jgi:hypothetical protein
MTDSAQHVETVSTVEMPDFDKFFESGGEDVSPKTKEEPVDSSDLAEEEAPQAKTNAPAEDIKPDHERNYKAALQEERDKRKESSRRLQENEAKIQRMELAFQQVLAKAQPQAPPPPSYDEDPLEALRHNQVQLNQALQQQQHNEYQRQQQGMRDQQIQQFVSHCRSKAEEFSKGQPDFYDAYKYLRQKQQDEYRTVGFDDAVIEQMLINDEMAISARAFEDEVNPAERFYNLAKRRGYKPADQKNGENEKFAQHERGIQASKSLSSTPGKTAKGKVSLESLAQMTDKEIDEFVKSGKWEAVLGGT